MSRGRRSRARCVPESRRHRSSEPSSTSQPSRDSRARRSRRDSLETRRRSRESSRTRDACGGASGEGVADALIINRPQLLTESTRDARARGRPEATRGWCVGSRSPRAPSRRRGRFARALGRIGRGNRDDGDLRASGRERRRRRRRRRYEGSVSAWTVDRERARILYRGARRPRFWGARGRELRRSDCPYCPNSPRAVR